MRVLAILPALLLLTLAFAATSAAATCRGSICVTTDGPRIDEGTLCIGAQCHEVVYPYLLVSVCAQQGSTWFCVGGAEEPVWTCEDTPETDPC